MEKTKLVEPVLARMVSKKGAGYWLAKHGENERVFYDGSYGTFNASRAAAVKWLEGFADKATVAIADRGKKMEDVIERMKNEGKISNEAYEELFEEIVEVFYTDESEVKVKLSNPKT